VFNRVHEEFPADPAMFVGGTVAREDEPAIVAALAAAAIPDEQTSWLARNFVDYQLLARGEALRMEEFRRGLARRTPFVTVPNFDSDLHDLHGLTRMHRYLFGGGGEAARGVQREGMGAGHKDAAVPVVSPGARDARVTRASARGTGRDRRRPAPRG